MKERSIIEIDGKRFFVESVEYDEYYPIGEYPIKRVILVAVKDGE